MPPRCLRLQLLVPAFLTLFFTGCMSVEPPSQPLRQPAWSACDQEWVLTSLKDGEHTYEYLLLWRKFWRERPFFTCDRFGYVRGSTGANPYLGRISLAENGEFTWTDTPKVSRMGKARPSDNLEADYLMALRKVHFLEVVDNRLILTSPNRLTQLEFSRVEEAMR